MEKDLRQKEAAGVKKIVTYGPESSGKTSLAKDLARAYQTEWVPEFARYYLQEKYDNSGEICAPEDLIPIAEGQIRWENQMLQKANRFLFCDTNPLQTYYYGMVYYDNFKNKALKEAAFAHSYDLYFLTDVDIPWVPDDLRDKPEQREDMFWFFKDSLLKNKKEFTILSGSRKERLEKAKKVISDRFQI